MFLIRSAEPGDFKSVVRLAEILNSYNLPADPKFLKCLLKDSVDSFGNRPVPAERRRFLFVAEEVRTKKAAGCSLIIARHGTPKLPHIAFRVGHEVKKSRFLRRSVEHQTLQLVIDRSGYTEIGGLVVLPAYRHRPNRLAAQLSCARFAYMAWHPEKFRSRVLVEYLPKLDPRSGNKFWHTLGARLTHLSYREADRFSTIDKEFVLSLFPKEKIYCSLLPMSQIRDLGVPGRGARASLRTLQRIGFTYLNQVDPFDGGPHYSAVRDRISVVRKTRFFRYRSAQDFEDASGRSALFMTVKNGEVLASRNIDLLNLEMGQRVSTTPVER